MLMRLFTTLFSPNLTPNVMYNAINIINVNPVYAEKKLIDAVLAGFQMYKNIDLKK